MEGFFLVCALVMIGAGLLLRCVLSPKAAAKGIARIAVNRAKRKWLG